MRSPESVKTKGRVVEAAGSANAVLGDRRLSKILDEAEARAVMDCYALAAKKPEALDPAFIRAAKAEARQRTREEYYAGLADARKKTDEEREAAWQAEQQAKKL